mgnify:CR=1 FL=1
MKCNCLYCKKELDRKKSVIKKGFYYCNPSCQLKYEYLIGKRDKYKIGIKARELSQKKMKEHNWLNDKKSRDNLKKTIQTDECRKKARESKLGDKNPMFGKRAWNFLGISKRDKFGCADRGFDWRKIKRKIKIRDNYTCQSCGIKENEVKQYLQVHHLVRYSIFKDNSDDNLLTLCSKCHAKYESQFIRISGIRRIQEETKVYNFSVKDDETYVANEFIVHNCRSTLGFSVEPKE